MRPLTWSLETSLHKYLVSKSMSMADFSMAVQGDLADLYFKLKGRIHSDCVTATRAMKASKCVDSGMPWAPILN